MTLGDSGHKAGRDGAGSRPEETIGRRGRHTARHEPPVTQDDQVSQVSPRSGLYPTKLV